MHEPVKSAATLWADFATPIRTAEINAVDIEGYGMAAADGVKPDAALKTGAGAAAEFALHLMLGDQFGGTDRHVEETVDAAVADVGMRRREIRLLGRETFNSLRGRGMNVFFIGGARPRARRSSGDPAIDQRHGGDLSSHGGEYHKRFLSFLERAQAANVVIGGAMTDPKGDRS
jgi:hypothetical protein